MAKLEGFVAMKTKPIHNSVKKWADIAISGAKSVIGWFRTGGKENRKIIERAEKRQRDHFRHKARKKNKRENNKKEQYTLP